MSELYSRSRLISKLDQIQQYLTKRVDKNPQYQELIDFLASKLELLRTHPPFTVKIVSPDRTLAADIKTRSHQNESLRSLYRFQVAMTPVNIPSIINDCDLIYAIYPVGASICPEHLGLIETAIARKILVIIAIASDSQLTQNELTAWCQGNIPQAISSEFLLLNDFIDLNLPQTLKSQHQILIAKAKLIDDSFSKRQLKQVQTKVELFFERQKQVLWQEIKEIKVKYLQTKDISQYRQNDLKSIFNQSNNLINQDFTVVKQQINQYRQQYLNPFLPDSWMFELERIIESFQVKIVIEDNQKYLYPIVEHQAKVEYLYSYILGLYQTKVSTELEQQWSKITLVATEGELHQIITKINHELHKLALFDDLEIPQIVFNESYTQFPQLDLNQFIDLQCLKLNSRIMFDYDYTKSSWFKLVIYFTVGLAIYLITELYFGQGRFIGFLIVILQLVNLITGQNQQKIRLKQHEKELKRIIIQKYQTLLRLIVEKLITTLINSLEINKKQIKQQLDAIATLANNRLDEIEQKIQRHKTSIEILDKDLKQIQSWFSC